MKVKSYDFIKLMSQAPVFKIERVGDDLEIYFQPLALQARFTQRYAIMRLDWLMFKNKQRNKIRRVKNKNRIKYRLAKLRNKPQCVGKKVYYSKDLALDMFPFRGKECLGMTVYQCSFCKRWHIGPTWHLRGEQLIGARNIFISKN